MTEPVFQPDNFDTSVDPGEDFYRYANGGWLAANPVPPEYSRWAAFTEVAVRNEDLLRELMESAADASTPPPGDVATDVATMAGDYWASGMDEAGIEAAGTAPLAWWMQRIEQATSVEDFRLLAADFHSSGIGFVFGAYVSPDFDDSDRNLMYVGQSGLGLPERDYYFRDDERSETIRTEYRTHIATQLASLGAPDGDHDAEAEADAILAFETALAEHSYTPTQLRDLDLTLNRFAFADVAGVMPGLGLHRYLEAVGAGGVESVSINNPGFFAAADTLLESTDTATLRAYARWNLVRATASSLPAVFADESFRFYGKVLGGQQEQKPRWKRVLAMATGDIGEVVGQIYVATAFPPEAKERAEKMVNHLLGATERSLSRLEWMTDETRSRALEKLAGFTYKIGYPDEWRDYSRLAIDRGPFVLNRLRADAFEYRRRIEMLDEPVDPNEWGMPPHMVNAYYHPVRNEIVFPAGILQPPFFFAEADDPVNYGGIGAVIGHEITHGFDDKGSRFDANGHFSNWWTDADRTEFERRAKLVEEQFDGYAIADDVTINGALTLGENIADLGGIAIAHRALLEALAENGVDLDAEIDGFTPIQRFFLSWATVWRTNATDEYRRLQVNADPHSPGEFRANGPLSNYTPFAEAFSLDDDAPMMRPGPDRIEIW